YTTSAAASPAATPAATTPATTTPVAISTAMSTTSSAAGTPAVSPPGTPSEMEIRHPDLPTNEIFESREEAYLVMLAHSLAAGFGLRIRKASKNSSLLVVYDRQEENESTALGKRLRGTKRYKY